VSAELTVELDGKMVAAQELIAVAPCYAG